VNIQPYVALQRQRHFFMITRMDCSSLKRSVTTMLKTICRKLTLIALLSCTLISYPVSALQSTGLPANRIDKIDWAAIRGVNYIPSYGQNLYEVWSNFNRDAFDRELAIAKKVGFNSVRLWLNYFAYAERGARMIDDVEAALTLCRKHGLKALIVLFDGCGVRSRPGAKTMTVGEAYGRFLKSPRLTDKLKQIIKFNYASFANGPGRDILIEASEDSSPHILLWQSWQPSPGYDKMGKEWWPKLDAYVRAVMDRLANDDTVLAWDIMNEPEWATEEPFTEGMNRPEVRDKVSSFLLHFRQLIKKRHPRELVTVGFATLDYCMEFESLADVLTFHVYGDPEALEKAIQRARDFSAKAGKPIFITETLANFSFMPYDVETIATDEGQLRHYQKVLPTLIKSRIGWMSWGLVIGRIFDAYCDIFYANGHPRPAAVYLERMLKGQ
jgi:hypothetical protein